MNVGLIGHEAKEEIYKPKETHKKRHLVITAFITLERWE